MAPLQKLLGAWSHLFIAIIPRTRVIVHVRDPSVSQMDPYKNPGLSAGVVECTDCISAEA